MKKNESNSIAFYLNSFLYALNYVQNLFTIAIDNQIYIFPAQNSITKANVWMLKYDLQITNDQMCSFYVCY